MNTKDVHNTPHPCSSKPHKHRAAGDPRALRVQGDSEGAQGKCVAPVTGQGEGAGRT